MGLPPEAVNKSICHVHCYECRPYTHLNVCVYIEISIATNILEWSEFVGTFLCQKMYYGLDEK